MRRTPAPRPTAAPLRPTAFVRRRLALRVAGAALCAGCLAPVSAWAQSGPSGGILGSVLPSSQKNERGIIAKMFHLPSKNASAGRAPGGPPPPPPAPHLKYDFRAAQARAAAHSASRTAAPSVARVAPVQPTDATPHLDAAAPQRTAQRAPAPESPAQSRSIAVSAEAAVGRVSMASPAVGTRQQGQYMAPRTAGVAAAPPSDATAIRAPAPPTLVADDVNFFPEQSEAEADHRFVHPRTVAVRAPEPEPATPTLEPSPTPAAPARVPAPDRVAVARIAAAPVRQPAPVVETAPFEVEEDAAEESGTPFSGLSLTASEPPPQYLTPAAAPVEAESPPAATPKLEATPELLAVAPAEDEGFALSAADDEEEAGWDLAVSARQPAAPAPVQQSKPAPATVEEPAVAQTTEPEPTRTAATAPPQAPQVTASSPQPPAAQPPAAQPTAAQPTAAQPTGPGRPDPTKLLEKLAARADRSLLMGFCPVTLRDDRDLAEGDDHYTAEFEGVDYRFASAAARDKFVADPARYAPAAGGRDLVIASTGWGETVGSLAHAAWYKGRLYLFASRESMRRFVANPRDYLDG
ncbi:hypothetical protein [Alienimonas californiensis]|uniref:YHS domain protein n=1 Tax=Alienimonas californiensis TaxID=2527989 RepID=A0A517PET3_9PLAN|nr:hypothetical protein [Alienimonas californiensis]QDT17891.1 YHS domain protein [Alienimonas californiensis]